MAPLMGMMVISGWRPAATRHTHGENPPANRSAIESSLLQGTLSPHQIDLIFR